MNDFDVSELVGENEFDGQGDTWELALEDAYKKARAHDHGPGWFKVKHWWVRMESPISEHKVIIKVGV